MFVSGKNNYKNTMNKLTPITKKEDILPEYRNTPIGLLLEYHNLGKFQETYDSAQLLVGMCMDNRKHLNIPDNFSFIIRSGGANLRYSEFKVSFAIAVGKIKHIALIGHNNCGMVNLVSRKEEFIEGLVGSAGWDEIKAEEHFTYFAPLFEIGNAIDFILSETIRLRFRYPKITIAPLFYTVEDNKLSFIKEKE
jgi:carbonic anhydrase